MNRDARWFDARWRTVAPLVMRICRAAAPRGEHEDCFAVTMEKAWEARETFEDERPFSNWVASIAANVCRDALRYYNQPKRKALVHSLDSVDGYGVPYAALIPSGLDVHADLETRELCALVDRAVDALPESYRGVVIGLRDGLTGKEIAAAQRIDAGTVRSRSHRARQRLREALAA